MYVEFIIILAHTNFKLENVAHSDNCTAMGTASSRINGCGILRPINGNYVQKILVCKLTLWRSSADCLIERPSSYRAVNTFNLGYKNQSVYAVSDTSRCLFSDKYKTHKYSVGRAYSCWMLNLLVQYIIGRL